MPVSNGSPPPRTHNNKAGHATEDGKFMALTQTYDIFITHAWRYHEDWTRMGELLDAADWLEWRNFSLPWHDPALDANTELGGNMIRTSLEKQVIPVVAVILLSGVYASGSGRKWLDIELDYSRRHDKPVIAVPRFGESEVPSDVREAAHAVCGWDAREIISAIDRRIGED